MIVFHAVQDCLRLCGQKYHTSVLLHLSNVTLSHRHTTAAGDDNVGLGLHFDKKFCLEVTEVFFSVCLKDIRNRHSFSLCNDLVHLNNFHCKYGSQEIRDRRFTCAHETDQHDIVIKELTSLDLLTVSCDLFKDSSHFIFMTSAFHSAVQPFSLSCFLLRLQDRDIVCFFISHDILYNSVTHKQCIQHDLVTLSKALSEYFQLIHMYRSLSYKQIYRC